MKENCSVIELFFHLIKCGIGKENVLPRTPCEGEWELIFEMDQKQTLVGIADTRRVLEWNNNCKRKLSATHVDIQTHIHTAA